VKNFYDIDTVKILEIELTTFCNANCGACDRNINGGKTNPKMPLEHMSLDTWKSLITAENLKYITTVTFDGNFGDAAMHPKMLEMLEYMATIKHDIFVKVSSNGGARNEEFWKGLAEVLNKFSFHEMQFAVDGLEDTNHIYRRNVIWKKLISNITAFNQAAGVSTWRAIIFDHNKHQVNDMMLLAGELGCYKFKTYRNRTTPIELTAYKNLPAGTITSPTTAEFEQLYKTIKQFRHYVIPYENKIVSNLYSCPMAEEQTIAVATNGQIWPCCFIYGNTITKHKPFPYEEWIENNVTHNNLGSILELFRKKLYPAWDKNTYPICNTCLHKTNGPTQHNV